MTTAFDFSPLFRSTIGFDHMADLLERATRLQGSDNWPPYNIEKTGGDAYRITMAVAGFTPEEINLSSSRRTRSWLRRASTPSPRAFRFCTAASQTGPSGRPSTWRIT